MLKRYILFLSLPILAINFAFTNFSAQVTSKKNAINLSDPSNCLDDMEIPKRFTPDGNDTTDLFIVEFPCIPASSEMQIYDQLGNEVYSIKTHEISWDGNDKKEQPCPSGIYSWKLKYMYQMTYVERNGQVLLLR